MKRLLLSLAILSACLIPATGAGTTIPLSFNPQDVSKYDAVVVTVCGMHSSDIKTAVLHHLFPHGAAAKAAAAAKLDELQLDASTGAAPVDTYLEDQLNGMLVAAGKHYLVVPLPWSRDVEQTAAAEAQIQAWLPQVYAAARANNKPLYAFSHSWGTMLMHHALISLAAQGSPVHVDRLVTIGSPLVPSSGLIHYFDSIELPAQDFGAQAGKPANVAVWTNFWAKRDLLSNSIPAADVNYRVDRSADQDQSLLDRACLDPRLTLEALKELRDLHKTNPWHRSYLWGYHKDFPAIHSKLDLDIPGADIVPVAF